MNYQVALEDGTVGRLEMGVTLGEQHAQDLLGEYVTVHLHDENGNPIRVCGKLAEVLTEEE